MKFDESNLRLMNVFGGEKDPSNLKEKDAKFINFDAPTGQLCSQMLLKFQETKYEFERGWGGAVINENFGNVRIYP